MSQLFQDWCDFCEDKIEFDKSHFYTLFQEEFDRSALGEIFKYFPQADELVNRTWNVKKIYPDNFVKADVDQNTMIEWAVVDLKNKRKACISLGGQDLVEIIDNVSPRFTQDLDEFKHARQSGWPEGELIVVLADYFSSKKIASDDKYYAIFEAFYGFTTNYAIQWYLAAPIMDTDINVDIYYDLWRSGGDYALTETEILVAQVH